MFGDKKDINLLSTKIIQYAYAGAELLKDEIKESANNNSRKYNLKWLLVLNEFLYFILHIANRISFAKLGQAKIGKFQNKIFPIVIKMMIVSFFDNSPKKLKESIEKDFVINLNNAEIAYSKCKTVFNDILTKVSPKIEESENGIINLLCSNLANIIGVETATLNIVSQCYVVAHAADIIKNKELKNLIIKIADKL